MRSWPAAAGNEGAEGRYGGAAGIYGGKRSGPVLVLTHRLDDEPSHPAVRFVGGPTERAVAEGLDAAGDGNLEIFGANVARQCLEAGLVDELVVHVAPILLGAGTRFYGEPDAPEVKLEVVDPEVHGDLTSLRMRVLPAG